MPDVAGVAAVTDMMKVHVSEEAVVLLQVRTSDLQPVHTAQRRTSQQITYGRTSGACVAASQHKAANWRCQRVKQLTRWDRVRDSIASVHELFSATQAGAHGRLVHWQLWGLVRV